MVIQGNRGKRGLAINKLADTSTKNRRFRSNYTGRLFVVAPFDLPFCFVEEKRIFNFCSKESLKLTEDLFLKLRLCTDCIFISLRSRKLGRKVGFSKRSFGRATSGSNFRLNLPLSLSFQVILKQRRIGGSILAFPTFNRKTPLFDPRQSFEGTPLPFCLL